MQPSHLQSDHNRLVLRPRAHRQYTILGTSALQHTHLCRQQIVPQPLRVEGPCRIVHKRRDAILLGLSFPLLLMPVLMMLMMMLIMMVVVLMLRGAVCGAFLMLMAAVVVMVVAIFTTAIRAAC